MKLLAAAVALAAFAFPAAAQAPAQAPPAPQARPAPAPDPKMLAAQAAFEALPEAERRAIQQDLGFATNFNGAALGTFGGLTYNGIQSFEREQKLAVDGILTPEERRKLAEIAQNARRALRFAVLDDERSRARLGVPQNVFTKREANASGGSRWQTADGKATLDTIVAPKDETLQQLFDRATSAQPNRKVTYKLLRPDFFVVTAETPTGKSYRRMSLGPDGAIRGFALGYDKGLAAEMDRLVIAVANSFDAFPGPAASPAPQVAAAAAGAAAPAARTMPPPIPRERLSTGVAIGEGRVLVAPAPASDCRTLAVGPRRASARVAFAAPSFAVLQVTGLPPALGAPLSTAASADGPATVIAQAWSGEAPAAVFAEAQVAGERAAAPLQPGGAGAALFDAQGALVGVVAEDPGARRQVAGVVPAWRYRILPAATIAQGLAAARIEFSKAPPLAAGASVAAARREAVLPVFCGS